MGASRPPSDHLPTLRKTNMEGGLKAPKFNYIRAESRQQALELLDQLGEDGRILAGGQSLMPTLNMRLSQPDTLIDINKVSDLGGISLEDNMVRIGAMTRHVEVANSPVIAEHLPLIAEASAMSGRCSAMTGEFATST